MSLPLPQCRSLAQCFTLQHYLLLVSACQFGKTFQLISYVVECFFFRSVKRYGVVARFRFPPSVLVCVYPFFIVGNRHFFTTYGIRSVGITVDIYDSFLSEEQNSLNLFFVSISPKSKSVIFSSEISGKLKYTRRLL